ncbi:Membrane protein insertase YidC [Saezia sanguinis]|uniref:Membrane protein insertase YidC n=1 Tax=Saezia sanguinis TaxID=1965230 RepID=A0A433S9Y5_9BURK|nr:membrane protein insertase YidC [Saezia sanguinis]RUS65557.1 Membrane protein insertase YidC [Saezia sanguinis]
MNDLRRTLLWVIFVFSLILLWDQWQVYNGRPKTFFPGGSTTTEQQAANNGSAAQNADQDVPTASGVQPAGSDNVAMPVAGQDSSAEKVVVTTDVYRLTFDTAGARITDLSLLRFADQEDKEQPFRLLSPAYAYEAQTGIINAGGGEAFPTHNTLMHLVAGPLEMAEGQNTLTVRFQSDAVNGVQVVKTFEFTRDSYVINMRTEVVNTGAVPVTPELYLQLVRNSDALPGGSMFWHTFTGPAYYTQDDKYNKVAFSDIVEGKKPLNAQTDNGWVGMVQHYFVTAWLLPEGTLRTYYTRSLGNNRVAIGMIAPLKTLAPGESLTSEAKLYTGPQNETVLEKLAPGLDLVKDYGMFKIFSKPLFWLLNMLHSLLNNWGWAIVALVVLIKAAFFWLNASAYRSMAKMKAVAPRVQEMRERYKDKPQQMQQEMMRIYREEKINPLGGCLPILVQIPVFIALYWVLLSSVEMRNAPWIGWITDLSVKDPYYILPIIMTASTLFQTWLNPTPPDPMQAKMMWIMPMVFSVMFFMFPSGLVLYWVTNNILSIAQQWFINKRLGVTRK